MGRTSPFTILKDKNKRINAIDIFIILIIAESGLFISHRTLFIAVTELQIINIISFVSIFYLRNLFKILDK